MSHNRLRGLIGFLLQFFLLLILTGCAVSVTPRGEEPTQQLTAYDEHDLGQRAFRQIVQQSGGVYPDRELAAYVNRIGQLLAKKNQNGAAEYHFAVLNDSTPEAISMPGGFVAVTRGLLVKLKSEAHLAAVLSGEIGHLVARHPSLRLSPEALRGAPVKLSGELSPASDYAALVNSLAYVQNSLLDIHYSLEQEIEADRIGIDLMAAAGFQLSAVAEVQELFLARMNDGNENSAFGGLLTTHLFSVARLKEARRYIADHYPGHDGRSGEDDFSAMISGLLQAEEGYVLYEKGRDLERQGQVAQAIETYHQALQAAPDEPLILSGLGLAYLRNEDPVPARRYLLKAVNLQGDYAQSRLGLGYVYLQKWQYAQAISQLEKSLQLLPTVEAAFLLAEVQQKIGNTIKARDLYLIVAGANQDGKLGQLASTRLQQLKGS